MEQLEFETAKLQDGKGLILHIQNWRDDSNQKETLQTLRQRLLERQMIEYWLKILQKTLIRTM